MEKPPPDTSGRGFCEAHLRAVKFFCHKKHQADSLKPTKMKKILTFFFAGAMIIAFCSACGDGGNGEPRRPGETKGEQPQDPNSERDPNTYVNENYRIINQMDSDIIVELKSGDGEVITINPGEELEVDSKEFCYEPDIAYSRARELVDADMQIGGEVVPERIWWVEYWNESREDGADDLHYSLTYSLTITNELVEKVRFESKITSLTSKYIIVNRINSDIVVELKSERRGIIIEPGKTQVVMSHTISAESIDHISDPVYGTLLNADMKVLGKTVDGIWWSDYWDIELEFIGDDSGCHSYTLTVTDELLKEVGFTVD